MLWASPGERPRQGRGRPGAWRDVLSELWRHVSLGALAIEPMGWGYGQHLWAAAREVRQGDDQVRFTRARAGLERMVPVDDDAMVRGYPSRVRKKGW